MVSFFLSRNVANLFEARARVQMQANERFHFGKYRAIFAQCSLSFFFCSSLSVSIHMFFFSAEQQKNKANKTYCKTMFAIIGLTTITHVSVIRVLAGDKCCCIVHSFTDKYTRTLGLAEWPLAPLDFLINFFLSRAFLSVCVHAARCTNFCTLKMTRHILRKSFYFQKILKIISFRIRVHCFFTEWLFQFSCNLLIMHYTKLSRFLID